MAESPPPVPAPAPLLPPTPPLLEHFNSCSNPKEVVALAESHSLSPDDLCAILHAGGRNVDSDLLGACLGHHGEFWQQFADLFAYHFEFGGLDIVTALRAYLWRFRLPGEAAPIGRILEGFALGYMNSNPPPPVGTPCRPNVPRVPGGTDPSACGWFVVQPKTAELACIACGALARADNSLRTCTGCGVVSFCSRCGRSAGRYGHAIRASIGFGRACEAAARRNGRLSNGHIIYKSTAIRDGVDASFVGEVDRGNWLAASPIKSKDAAFILAYAVVMLSTNLHNPSVKSSDKMELHQFLQQLRGQNDGSPFPGDYLEGIYKAIQIEELKVMTV
uniref:SEC7 domain-containing protein n=1 Tax=Calcidiscus leptoporus TaxID=127549 RepID=A0A7S0P155_9EUKA